MTTDKALPETKERIFETARRLFAKQGFGATGVRQIAREAGVNLAMINYFFDSKLGLHKAILSDFYGKLLSKVERVASESITPEETTRQVITSVVEYYRSNTDGVVIALTEIPRDSGEIVQFKADQISGVFPELASKVLTPLEQKYGSKLPLTNLAAAIGPMIGLMVASHFLVKPVAERVGLMEFNDDFYEIYPDLVANILLYGLTGVKDWTFKQTKEKNGDNDD